MSESCCLDTCLGPLIVTCPADSVSSAARSPSRDRYLLCRRFASPLSGLNWSTTFCCRDWAVFALHPLPLPSTALLLAAWREVEALLRLAKPGNSGACRCACCALSNVTLIDKLRFRPQFLWALRDNFRAYVVLLRGDVEFVAQRSAHGQRRVKLVSFRVLSGCVSLGQHSGASSWASPRMASS